MAPRRVLFVIDALVTGAAGTERQLLDLIGALDRTAFEPHLAVFRSSDYLEAGAGVPCEVHDLDVPRLASPITAFRLAGLSRLVSRLETGVVHVLFNDAAIAAPLFGRLGGARVVASRRDMGFWYTPAILGALRLSNRFVDRIIANSEAVRQNVARCERYPLERIIVIPNGHAPERFEQEPDPRLREQLGIPTTGRIVGMVANLYPRKRQLDLVAALGPIRAVCPDVHVIFVGSGEDQARILEAAAAQGHAGQVHVLTGVSNPIPIIKQFDVAVLCSDSEGFSNALLEYAFCERPIVCTDVGGNAEIVDDRTGRLVPRGHPARLAGAILEFLTESTVAGVVARRARARAESRYTLTAMAGRYEDLYQGLASARTIGDRATQIT